MIGFIFIDNHVGKLFEGCLSEVFINPFVGFWISEDYINNAFQLFNKTYSKSRHLFSIPMGSFDDFYSGFFFNLEAVAPKLIFQSSLFYVLPAIRFAVAFFVAFFPGVQLIFHYRR